MLEELKTEIHNSADEKQARILQRFFKTGEGEYGEGDVFIGIAVPQMRKLAKKYSEMPLVKVQKLLDSKVHEHRFIGLIILVNKFEKSSEAEKENIFNFYLDNTKNINNWDLVDISAHKIVGEFLREKEKDILYDLAVSENLWEKRIAIISTGNFIWKDAKIEETFEISKLLLGDLHDLIHKAVGWMLREAGKKDIEALKNFLREHYDKIPRTTLRYAIEKFEEDERKKWLRGEI